MSLASWLGKRIGLTDGKFWSLFYGGETFTKRPVTMDTALQVSAFWACVRLISQTVGTLSLGLYERQEDGGRLARADHPLYSVLHDMPNADQTSVEFWEGVGVALCIWGNSYSEKLLAGNKAVIGLRTLETPHTVVERNRAGELEYRYTDRGKTETLPEEKVLHIRGFGMGGDLGLSPLAYARQALSIASATEEATGRTFGDGLRAKGFFMMPGTMTDEQRAQAQKSLVEPFSGPGGKSIGILEAGVKFEKTDLSPHDAEMLLNRRHTVEDICRFLGVPPIMVGHAGEGQTMWGTGVESLLIQFYTMGLRPYLVRIEKSIFRSLLTPKERKLLYAEFNIESLLRADSAGRASLWSTLVQNGIMDRNEVRAKENLPKREGADLLTVQSNLVALSSLGTTTQAPAAGRRLEVVK